MHTIKGPHRRSHHFELVPFDLSLHGRHLSLRGDEECAPNRIRSDGPTGMACGMEGAPFPESSQCNTIGRVSTVTQAVNKSSVFSRVGLTTFKNARCGDGANVYHKINIMQV